MTVEFAPRPEYGLVELLVPRGTAGARAAARTRWCSPVGFQNSVPACDLRRSAFHAAGMIPSVTLGLLYLILDRVVS